MQMKAILHLYIEIFIKFGDVKIFTSTPVGKQGEKHNHLLIQVEFYLVL